MKRKLLSILALLFIAASMSAKDIYVKYTTGKTITLDVDLDNATILTVKGMVYDKEGVPVAQHGLHATTARRALRPVTTRRYSRPH